MNFRVWIESSEPVTGQPFSMIGFHATTRNFSQLDIQGNTRTKTSDLTARGIFFYGDRFDAERLFLGDGKRRIIEAKLHFRNPFVFRKFQDLYEYVGVSHRDPQKADKVTAALKSKGHDGYVKLYQSKSGVDEVVVFDKSQIEANYERDVSQIDRNPSLQRSVQTDRGG